MNGQPRRIQLSRNKGWRMPPNTLSVARPGKWGNPFVVGRDGDAAACVAAFRRSLEFRLNVPGAGYIVNSSLQALRGKDLACWCPLDKPCHADVLLELANAQPIARKIEGGLGNG